MEGRARILSLCYQERCPPSSEVRDAPEEVKAAGLGAVLAITSSKESAKENDPFGAAETNESQNLDAPQEIVRSVGEAPVSHAEGLVLLVEPFQSVPLSEGSKDLETCPAKLSKVGAKARSKE